MRADSSVREPRSSLIKEDAAVMKAIQLRGRSACQPKAALQGSFAALVIADANGLIDAGKKNLAVANLPRARGSQNRLHRLIDQGVGQHHLELGFWNQIHAVLATAVDLSMTFLSPMAAHFQHRHAFYADLLQSGFHGVEF